MIVFASDAYQDMATAAIGKAANLTSGKFRVARFENGELYIEVQTSPANETCLAIGSIAPPDERLISVLLLAHTLKKEGARRVIAILPYLAYARHDKDKPGESLAAAWAGALMQASGIDQLITVDVHSERAKALFPVPVISLSPAGIFAEALRNYSLRDAVIVAPDGGAIGRCQAVAVAAGLSGDKIPYFEKRRTPTGITHRGPFGEVGRSVVIVDDILDTGGTLLSACEKLQAGGVEDISIMATHGLFTGKRWKELWRLGVKRIFCTDSVPLPAGLDGDRIVTLPLAPLLEFTLRGLA